MANFHRKGEEQLFRLKAFWDIPENKEASWIVDSCPAPCQVDSEKNKNNL